MTKCRVSHDEIDHDMQQGRWAPIKSLFEEAEPVFDIEPEQLKKPGKWHKTGVKGLEIYKVDGEKEFNNV